MDVSWRDLCQSDLRKYYLDLLSRAMVRRVIQGSMSSELLMCGRRVHIMLVLLLVARCIETIVCVYGECCYGACLQLYSVRMFVV